MDGWMDGWLWLAGWGGGVCCWLAAGCCLLLMAARDLLLAASCCWLLGAAGFWLLDACCWLPAAGCCWLLAGWLLAACWLLSAAVCCWLRAAGPIMGLMIIRSPIWKNPLVQQAIGPAAGPIVGWRINLVPCCGELACPAGRRSSCWTHSGLED